jgi:SAM-dependent methyltransferase
VSLSLGSGRGAFLRKAHSRGAQTTGLELNSEAVAYCAAMDIDARNQSIEDFAWESPAAFDVVTSFQVLEHSADPVPALEGACKVLRVCGLLAITVLKNDSFSLNELEALNSPPHHMGRCTAKALLWLQRRLPLRALDIHYEPLSGQLPLRRLTPRAAKEARFHSLKHRLARGVLGEHRTRALASAVGGGRA